MALFLSPIAKDVRKELIRRTQEEQVKAGDPKVGTIPNSTQTPPGKLIDQDLKTGFKETLVQNIYGRSIWMRCTPTTKVKTKDGDEPTPILAGGLLNDEGEYRAGIPQYGKDGAAASFDEYMVGKGANNSIYRHKGNDKAYGNRPMHGITDINVKHTGELGSVTEVALKWICWDFEMLDRLMPYYLRPGAMILVEFGWSSDVADIEQQSAVRKNIAEYAWNKGKYLNPHSEYYYGQVTTFNWSVRPDGGIDCTTNMMAGGALLLQQSITDSAGSAGSTAAQKWKSVMDQIIDMDSYAKGIGFPNHNKVKEFFKGKYNTGISYLQNPPQIGCSAVEGDAEKTFDPYVDGDYTKNAPKTGYAGNDNLPGIVYNYDDGDQDCYYFSWGWFEDNILSKVLGLTNGDSDAAAAMTYRSIEFNPVLNNEEGGYQSTRFVGHKDMMSFNGWICWLPTKEINSPFRMGKLSGKKGEEGASGTLERLYSVGNDKYEIKDGKLIINGKVQETTVDELGRRPAQLNWRDHFEPALVQDEHGKWVVIARNIVISKKFVDEVFSPAKQNTFDPTKPNFDMYSDPAETTDELYSRVFEVWNKLIAGGAWDLSLVSDDHQVGNCKVIDKNWSSQPVDKLIKADTDDTNKPFFFPAFGINSIVKSQAMDCKIPDEMAMEVMYGSNAFDDNGNKGSDNRSTSMVSEALNTIGANSTGRKAGDKIFNPMKSPVDDKSFGNKTPYKMCKGDDGTLNCIAGGSNNTALNETVKEEVKEGETIGVENPNDPNALQDSQEEIMERKQAVRIATFTEKASDDLRDNYEGMRENYAEMYKELPSSISIQAYFTENTITGDSSPPEIDVEAEASEDDLNKLAEWMGHFRDWLKWLQLKKHGGGMDMAQLGFDNDTSDDKNPSGIQSWGHAEKMIEWYWYCIKFLNAKNQAFSSIHHEISYFLPINIKLEIDGIGGLQYGNSFMTDYIPDQYKDHTVFQIGQIEHALNNQGWTTSFQGLMRMKPIKEFLEEIEETT